MLPSRVACVLQQRVEAKGHEVAVRLVGHACTRAGSMATEGRGTGP